MADTPAQQAAAGLLAELEQFAEEETVEAPEAEATVEQPQEETVEIPDINWDTPEELKDVLSGPEYDPEEEEEEWEDEGGRPEDEEEFEDPVAKKKMAKLEKQLKWEREQRIKASRKNWADEARKYFQFSNPEVIHADSRRAFLKEAQRQHMAVAKVAKPVFDQLAAERARIKEEALAEARAEAERAWGRPTSGPTFQHMPNESTEGRKRERLGNARDLTKVIGDRLKKGDVII